MQPCNNQASPLSHTIGSFQFISTLVISHVAECCTNATQHTTSTLMFQQQNSVADEQKLEIPKTPQDKRFIFSCSQTYGDLKSLFMSIKFNKIVEGCGFIRLTIIRIIFQPAKILVSYSELLRICTSSDNKYTSNQELQDCRVTSWKNTIS
jgi:hypothetical protein